MPSRWPSRTCGSYVECLLGAVRNDAIKLSGEMSPTHMAAQINAKRADNTAGQQLDAKIN